MLRDFSSYTENFDRIQNDAEPEKREKEAGTA